MSLIWILILKDGRTSRIDLRLFFNIISIIKILYYIYNHNIFYIIIYKVYYDVISHYGFYSSFIIIYILWVIKSICLETTINNNMNIQNKILTIKEGI